MSCGATIVTFLLLAGIVPGRMNWRHVIDEIHEIRSPSSVSGFMFSFTMRLLAGNLWHELNSRSACESTTPGVAPAAPGTAAPGLSGVAAVAPAAGTTVAPPGAGGFTP